MQLPIRPQLIKLFIGKLAIGPFEDYFRQPSYFYGQGWPESPGDWPTFSSRQLLPLWEHASRIQVLDLASHPIECLSFYVECPEEYTAWRSVDDAVFDMIYRHVWEYGGDEKEAEEAMRFAELVALPNLSLLGNLLADVVNCSDEMILEFRKQL